jgi:hypothetical protein
VATPSANNPLSLALLTARDRTLYESYAALGASARFARLPVPGASSADNPSGGADAAARTASLPPVPLPAAGPGRVHIVTAKSEIDLFRASVLVGGGPGAVRAALEGGVGTTTELSAFETTTAGGSRMGGGGGSMLSSSASSYPGGVHPLAAAHLGEIAASGPLSGLPRGRLAGQDIRAALAGGEAQREALYRLYVSGTHLSATTMGASTAAIADPVPAALLITTGAGWR